VFDVDFKIKLIPFIKLDGSQSATVVFKTPQAANHARQKLHGFEYPPGERLIVKFNSEMKSLSLLETQMPSCDSNSTSFCSVNLPPIQPLSKETNVAQRCFIVLSPNTLPTNLLKQVFCRFGNLIDVYLLSNRNCGYVKYSSIESAKQVRNQHINYKINLTTNRSVETTRVTLIE
jgi:hypothetical protein